MDVRAAVAHAADAPLTIETVQLTPRVPLERINEGFDLMLAGESIRSVVIY